MTSSIRHLGCNDFAPGAPLDSTVIASPGGGSAAAASSTVNWAGVEATGFAYHHAQGNWYVPQPSSTAEYTSGQEVSWVGIGQGDSASDPLVQAGSLTDGSTTNKTAGAFLWYQFCCKPIGYQGSYTEIRPASIGDFIQVVVFALNKTDFVEIWDDTAGWASGQIAGPTLSKDYSGTTAEWVYERPEVNDLGLPYLARAGHEAATESDFYGADAEYPQVSTYQPVGKLPNYGIKMTDCPGSTRLAYPGAINSSNSDQFPVYWTNYGDEYKCTP